MINQFKKIHRKISTLRVSLATIIIIIVLAISIVGIKINNISNTINSAYAKMQEIKNLNNYRISIAEDYYDSTSQKYNHYPVHTIYYKDGKFKDSFGNTTTFYMLNSYERTYVFDDTKQIDHYATYTIKATKSSSLDFYYRLFNFKHEYSIWSKAGLHLNKGNYNGRECNIIRNGSKNDYSDIWIDSKTHEFVKEENCSNNIVYDKIEIVITPNIVKDSDVDKNILNSDKYKSYKRNEITEAPSHKNEYDKFSKYLENE